VKLEIAPTESESGSVPFCGAEDLPGKTLASLRSLTIVVLPSTPFYQRRCWLSQAAECYAGVRISDKAARGSSRTMMPLARTGRFAHVLRSSSCDLEHF